MFNFRIIRGDSYQVKKVRVISWKSKFAGNTKLRGEAIFKAVVPGVSKKKKLAIKVFTQSFYNAKADGSFIKAQRTIATPFKKKNKRKSRQVGFYFNFYLNRNFTKKYKLIL